MVVLLSSRISMEKPTTTHTSPSFERIALAVLCQKKEEIGYHPFLLLDNPTSLDDVFFSYQYRDALPICFVSAHHNFCSSGRSMDVEKWQTDTSISRPMPFHLVYRYLGNSFSQRPFLYQ
jgi:hypothetical protein